MTFNDDYHSCTRHNNNVIFYSADTLNIVDPDELDLCSIVWTVANYVVANLDDQLPRDGDYPTKEPPIGAAGFVAPQFACVIMISLGILFNRFAFMQNQF